MEAIAPLQADSFMQRFLQQLRVLDGFARQPALVVGSVDFARSLGPLSMPKLEQTGIKEP